MIWLLGYIAIAAVVSGVLYVLDPFTDELLDREDRLVVYTFLSTIWFVVLFVTVGKLIAMPFKKG